MKIVGEKMGIYFDKDTIQESEEKINELIVLILLQNFDKIK